MLERFRKRRRRAARQEGDVHALDCEDDPRGGVQSDRYRTADPRDSVRGGVGGVGGADGVVMGAPGGAPQEGKSVEERRRESEEWRDRREGAQ